MGSCGDRQKNARTTLPRTSFPQPLRAHLSTLLAIPSQASTQETARILSALRFTSKHGAR
eukprot:6191357-Pleurochrysis_carterae.AAC.2